MNQLPVDYTKSGAIGHLHNGRIPTPRASLALRQASTLTVPQPLCTQALCTSTHLSAQSRQRVLNTLSDKDSPDKSPPRSVWPVSLTVMARDTGLAVSQYALSVVSDKTAYVPRALEGPPMLSHLT